MYLISILISYLIGGIPFGIILTRIKGIDLRSVGSGNIGATNVGRALGKKWGIFCFILDACKGMFPMLIMHLLVRPHYLTQGGQATNFIWLWMACGCAAVLGHVFPVYIGFKGGKGVATSFGVGLGLWPYFTVAAILSLLIWAVVLKICRYVSLSSMIAATAFPLLLLGLILIVPSWSLTQLWPIMTVAGAIPVLVIILHRSNIRRLCTGTENRIGQAKKEA